MLGEGMKFLVCDVEHGLFICIKTPSGQFHCIDVGSSEKSSLSEYAKETLDIEKVDYLIISHPDKDHVEGLPYFIKFFGQPRVLRINRSLPRSEFCGNTGTKTEPHQIVLKKLYEDYTAPVEYEKNPTNPNFNGGIEYEIFSLSHGKFPDGCVLEKNNTSIVVFMLYKGILFVCPGDIEPKGWDFLWKQNYSKLEPFIKKSHKRILVAPHHGRESGYSEEMMQSIAPNLVIISDEVGGQTDNRYYNMPIGLNFNGESIKCLSTKTKGSVLLNVDQNGSIDIKLSTAKAPIQTSKQIPTRDIFSNETL